jgi:hypothetical protein
MWLTLFIVLQLLVGTVSIFIVHLLWRLAARKKTWW